MTAQPLQGLPPGASNTVRFVAESPGEFYIVCPVGNHAEQGMWVRLLVSFWETSA